MNYIYTARGNDYSFTDAMREKVESQFNKLKRYLSDEAIKITLSKEGINFVLKVQVVTKENKHIRVEERGEEFYDLITKAKESIELQIHKAKTKLSWRERIKKAEPTIEQAEPLIIKTKEFTLEEMTTEMAINEMEKLGHDWYAYKDLNKDGAISIVYRRIDDNYSVIILK